MRPACLLLCRRQPLCNIPGREIFIYRAPPVMVPGRRSSSTKLVIFASTPTVRPTTRPMAEAIKCTKAVTSHHGPRRPTTRRPTRPHCPNYPQDVSWNNIFFLQKNLAIAHYYPARRSGKKCAKLANEGGAVPAADRSPSIR